MRKIVSKWTCLLGVCLLIIAAAVASVRNIYAEGGGVSWAGPGGTGGGNSNCESRTFSKKTWNRCGGVTWVKRPVDAAHAACTAIGATEYYKLGGNLYTGSGMNPNYTGDIGKALKTSYAYLLPYRPGVSSGSVPKAQAEADYQIAQRYLPAGSPSWANTGEFCWNEAWRCSESECPPIDPPDDTEDTIYGEGSFWAESHLTVTNEVTTHTADVSSKEGAAHSDVTIKVSTNGTAYVTFSHNMFYDEELWNPTAATYTNKARSGHAPKSTDDFEEIKTKLKIQEYGESNSSIKDEDFGTGKSGAKNGQQVSTNTVSVTPDPGTTLTVCQVLTHQSVKYVIKGEDNDTTSSSTSTGTGTGASTGTTTTAPATPTVTHDNWEFTKHAEDNNIGLTMLCAEVYRPEDPSGGDPSIWAKGESGNKPMFAGETSKIGWHVRAEWEEARRVVDWKAIAFTIDSTFPYHEQSLKGNLSHVNNTDPEPCPFYRNKSTHWGGPYTWCSTTDYHSSGSLSESGTHDDGPVENLIAIEDYVGYKYCTSFGYKWEYFYSISYSGQDNWLSEGRSYWTNYDAACRTIAKKPSVAYWNSGIMTNGGVKTSLSPRITGQNLRGPSGFQIASSSRQYDYLYGSWAEHLAAIYGLTTSFGSGGSLSRGSSSGNGSYDKVDSDKRSPMTIANTNNSSLGHSNIRTSNTLRTRLDTYLRNRSSIDSINGLPVSGNDYYITSGTYILNTSNLTINRNIIVSGGNYASIYQIPQVVIFVNGDVNITGNVTEIDAWIIATGEINTCKGQEGAQFQDGVTQTASRAYSSNTACDKQLIINGPVMASSADLRRSFGSDPVAYGNSSARYTPGEIFNLSGENYLWAYAQAGRYSSSYTEAYSRELAPRY